MAHYDYIIVGGGAAGLSLAYHLMHGGVHEKTLLIIDPVEKTMNDRTWCFWIDRPMLFDPIVTHRWRHFWFHGPDRSHRIDLAPYDYRMIRGIDFYRFVLTDLESRANVTFLRENVERIEDGRYSTGEPALVYSDGGNTNTADFVFNSIFLPRDFRVDVNRYFFLKQHFAGWTIRTREPVFDPGAATFFDLRVEQKGAFRFMYLLPTSPTESLVEYTLFSSRILPPDEYQDAIRAYIKKYLGDVEYTILEQEEGIIPMTDQPFPRRDGERILNTGTRGGRVKASTGFAFYRMQQDNERIVNSIRSEGHPFHTHHPPRRYATFDAMLLSVLDQAGEDGRDIFVGLFERNPVTRVLRFLDEEGTLWENITLMASVPWWTFIRAWFRVKWRRRPWVLPRLVDALGREQENDG